MTLLEKRVNRINNKEDKEKLKDQLKELYKLEKKLRMKKYLEVRDWLYLAHDTLLKRICHEIGEQLDFQENQGE